MFWRSWSVRPRDKLCTPHPARPAAPEAGGDLLLLLGSRCRLQTRCLIVTPVSLTPVTKHSISVISNLHCPPASAYGMRPLSLVK